MKRATGKKDEHCREEALSRPVPPPLSSAGTPGEGVKSDGGGRRYRAACLVRSLKTFAAVLRRGI